MTKTKNRDMFALGVVAQVRALHAKLDGFRKEFADATTIAPEAFNRFTELLVEANKVLLTRWTDE